MRIGTWNVEYAAGAEKNARRYRRLLEMNCDIWVLTETHDELDLHAAGYHAVSTKQREGRRSGSRWTTIWSRFPIMKTAVAVEDPVRTVAAMIAAPVGNLLVFGTVLPWGNDHGPEGTARGWTEFYTVAPKQGAEWARLRAAHPDAALCVAGDLNMNLGGPHYYGTAKGRLMLRAALAEADLKCVTETERTVGQLAHGPIDHICVSSQLARGAGPVQAWEGQDADGVRLSDHSGLVVTIDSGGTQ